MSDKKEAEGRALPAEPTRTFEEFASELFTHPAIAAATKAYFGWALGKRLTRSEYDSAIAKVANLTFQ